uniref:Response regulatory domain-containing protein n=1 Tax=Eutreptiella gymnastica TaxID=73025 RepID=A0A7S4LCM7_9EUGL
MSPRSSGSYASARFLHPAHEKRDDAAPVVNNRSTANEESTFENESKAMQIKVLYHWCVTAGVLLVMQIIADALLSKYRHVPNPAQLCAILLLLYALALVVTTHFVSRARPYAVYLLGFGSVLMTGQVAWHWESHAAQFRASNGIFPGQPSFWDMNFCNTTTSGQGSADLLPHISPYGLAFGCSGAELLETATFFIILFQHCVQSSFLSRLGIRFTAIVSLTQWLLLACWPLMFPDVHGTWFCRITATGVWTVHLLQSSWFSQSVLQQHTQAMDDLQKVAAQSLKNQRDAQHADSVLNHILKNTMADALGCIEFFCRNPNPNTSALSKACDILFRGMWWCKLREAMLSMVAGRYETVQSATDIQHWAQEFVRGRNVALECPTEVVKMDATACSVVLDNAMSNATRHGCPHDPQVKLAVEVLDQDMDGQRACSEDNPCGRPVVLRFEVSNRANAERPPLQVSWTSDGPSDALANESSRPTLSDGLGLQHISMVVNLCGMKARLWQHECRVFFELRLNTQIAVGARLESTEVVKMTRPVPMDLNILCLDDSPVARQSLQYMLPAHIPGATVATFGKNLEEVHEFKKAALTDGDLVILDQNVDVPEAKLKGTDIVKELVADGYKGFACIRSGDCSEEDRALSHQSGAHWHVGKELRLRDMSEQLMFKYSIFLQERADMSDNDSTATQLLKETSITDLAREIEASHSTKSVSAGMTFSSSSCILQAPIGPYVAEERNSPRLPLQSTEQSPGSSTSLRASATFGLQEPIPTWETTSKCFPKSVSLGI